MKYTVSDEYESKSEYSPGIVRDDEDVVRISYEPEDMKSGRLIPSSIKTADLEDRGYSIFRYKFLEQSEVDPIVKAQQAKMPNERAHAYAAILLVEKIRLCFYQCEQNSKKRSFVVIDNALVNLISHCAVYSTCKLKGSRKLQLKNQLIDIVNQYIVFDNKIYSK